MPYQAWEPDPSADPGRGCIAVPAAPCVPEPYSSQTWEKSAVVIDSPATLYGFTGFNKNAADRYIMVFDAAALPVNGSIPTIPPIDASGEYHFVYDSQDRGQPFANGIVIASSSTYNELTLSATDDLLLRVIYDPKRADSQP